LAFINNWFAVIEQVSSSGFACRSPLWNRSAGCPRAAVKLAAIINKDNPDVDRRHGAEPLALSGTRLPPSANPTT
jgi:hypothetical protein